MLSPEAKHVLKAIGDRHRPPTDAMVHRANRMCDGWVHIQWQERTGLHVWLQQIQFFDGQLWMDTLPRSLTFWACYIEEIHRDGTGWVHKNKHGPAGKIEKATRSFGGFRHAMIRPTWYQRVMTSEF